MDTTTPLPKHGAGKPRQRALLPQIVDQIASSDPSAVYGMWPVIPSSYEAGFRSITYAQLANMVNGLAWWLADNLDQDSDVIAYVGPNDARVAALGLATTKAEKSLFHTSPRNSLEAHQSLFATLDCKTCVTPQPIPPLAHPILETLSLRHLVIPTVDELLQTTFPQYEYSKALDEGLNDCAMIIHTSGSTGKPKPLIWTQETVLRHHKASSCPAPTGVPSLENLYLSKRILVTLPHFHGAGLGQTFLYAIPFGNIVVAPAAAAIVTAQGLVDALRRTPADIALLVPSVVAELAQNPGLLRYCAEHLEMIVYIGGDLPQQVGDIVASALPLRCQWGASEVGMPPQLISPDLDPRTDWKYVRFHPCAGMVFEEVAENLYELVIRRDKGLTSTQPTFTIQGKENLHEYRTRDLFSPHPTVPDEWAWAARADDLIVFLNGEKTNPIVMEQYLVAMNPGLLSGALVVGTRRFQAALLLEPFAPIQTISEQADLIERVWPVIEEANRVAPAHARVEKSLVLITSPNRPLVRAGKGTLQRGSSLALYENEINALYENVEKAALLDSEESGDDEGHTAALNDVDLVARRIRHAVLQVTDWPAMKYDEDSEPSFFELGMDSLQALRLTRVLRRALHRPNLGLSTIYQNPTTRDLARAVTEMGSSDTTKEGREVMESFLATYRQLIREIPTLADKPSSLADNKEESALIDVVLTGSTGTLGSIILRALLDRESIGHVYCLNRASDGGRSAQAAKWGTPNGHATDSVSPGIPESRVTFLQADLARPTLGLNQAVYEALQSRVGLVIHGAWPVNFNLALSAFRPQLAGMLNLFSFAAATTHHARVFFLSTVGAVAGQAAFTTGPASESIIDSLDAAHASGYAKSKLLSELLCDTASRHLGIPVSVARIGQVAGPVDKARGGIWKRTEWLPSIVASSFHLSCLPEDLGHQFSVVDWMPSDLAAEIIVDIATAEASSDNRNGPNVFNLRNPSTTTWRSLIPAIQDFSRGQFGRELEVVPSSIWLERLVKSAQNGTGDDLAASVLANPAIKLLDFYRDGIWVEGPIVQSMSIDSAVRVSPTLRDMPAIQAEWMRKWVEDWLA